MKVGESGYYRWLKKQQTNETAASFGRNESNTQREPGQRQLWRRAHENCLASKRHTGKPQDCLQSDEGKRTAAQTAHTAWHHESDNDGSEGEKPHKAQFWRRRAA